VEDLVEEEMDEIRQENIAHKTYFKIIVKVREGLRISFSISVI